MRQLTADEKTFLEELLVNVRRNPCQGRPEGRRYAGKRLDRGRWTRTPSLNYSGQSGKKHFNELLFG